MITFISRWEEESEYSHKQLGGRECVLESHVWYSKCVVCTVYQCVVLVHHYEDYHRKLLFSVNIYKIFQKYFQPYIIVPVGKIQFYLPNC